MPAPPEDTVPEVDLSLRRVERIGWAVAVVYAIVLAIAGIVQPDPYANPFGLLIANLFVGRAVNITWGLSEGFSRLYLFFQCGGGDIVVLFLLYPWLVAGSRRAEAWPWFHRWLDRLRASAERHKTGIARYGPVGLALFVVFPFWSTGALVGGVVGNLLGMRPLPVFASVTIGNFVATAVWIAFFDQMRRISDVLGHWMPVILLVCIVAVGLYYQFKKRRQRHTAKSD